MSRKSINLFQTYFAQNYVYYKYAQPHSDYKCVNTSKTNKFWELSGTEVLSFWLMSLHTEEISNITATNEIKSTNRENYVLNDTISYLNFTNYRNLKIDR